MSLGKTKKEYTQTSTVFKTTRVLMIVQQHRFNVVRPNFVSLRKSSGATG